MDRDNTARGRASREKGKRGERGGFAFIFFKQRSVDVQAGSFYFKIPGFYDPLSVSASKIHFSTSIKRRRMVDDRLSASFQISRCRSCQSARLSSKTVVF